MTKADHPDIREAIQQLPAGSKESAAWEKIGLPARLSRHEFRDLWLEIRVPKASNPKTEQPQPGRRAETK